MALNNCCESEIVKYEKNNHYGFSALCVAESLSAKNLWQLVDKKLLRKNIIAANSSAA